jgi:anti-sigma regulatory factor (Ser/Thr protein kinase)
VLEAHIDLLDDLQAPRAARRATRAILKGWGYRDDAALEAVELVVTELVTNALRHAGGGFQLQLQSGRSLRVAVADGSALVPVARAMDDEGESGRGVHIVTELARDWGVEEREGGGKRIWVDLPFAPR